MLPRGCRCAAAVSLLAVAMVFLYPARASTSDGLVLYYKFDNVSAGCIDSSGYNNTGNLWRGTSSDTSTYSLTTGVVGGALELQQTTNYGVYVESYNPVSLTASSNYTIAAWFRMSSSPNTMGLFLFKSSKQGSTTAATYYTMWHVGPFNLDGSGRNLTARMRRGSAYPSLSSSSELAVGTWFHVAMTCNGSIARLYLNGVLVGGLPALNLPQTVYADIGLSADSANFYGAIDEFRIYNRVLSVSELSALHSPSCGKGHYVPSGSTNSNCTAYECKAGYTDDDSDQTTACVACSAGTYVPAGSYGNCSSFQCPAGSLDDDNNPATKCTNNCGAGYYIPKGSSGSCSSFLCAAGTTDYDSNASTPCVSCGNVSCSPAGWSGSCSNYKCNDNDSCTTDTCTTSGCVYKTMSCDDGSNCTKDTCSNGVCSHTSSCSGSDAATIKNCTKTGCSCTPICKYSFSYPEIPVFPFSATSGDIQLNSGNAIRMSSGSSLSQGCNGATLSYLKDDGTWTSSYTDVNGNKRTSIDLFYATATSALNVRTVQSYQSNLPKLLAGRTLKLTITCNNGVSSCLIFKISPATPTIKMCA